LGPGQATDNLTGLGAGLCKSLGQVGTGTAVFDYPIAPMTFKTGVNAAGTLDVYLATSEGTTNWTDGINPSSVADQGPLLKTATRVKSVRVEGGPSVYHVDGWSVAAVLGYTPMYFCVLIQNNTGVAFDSVAANFAAQYSTQALNPPAAIIYA
jgi:hypothetical protein